MVRRITTEVPPDVLQKDLEKYRKRAIELGATDARIITTDMIFIDERVRGKCCFPLCSAYGTNAKCPPHALEVDFIRKMVNNFHYAIFTKFEVPSEYMAGPEAKTTRVRYQVKNFEIVSKIESF